MAENIDIRRTDRDVQTYEVPLPEGGVFILEYAKHKPDEQRCKTLSMQFPGDVRAERLGQVCRVDGSGIHTTPPIADRYKGLPEEVRNAIVEQISSEAKDLLQMI